MKKEVHYLVGDFETTVYDGQEFTEVWASGLCELYTEDAIILHSIEETFDYLLKQNKNYVIYYHNLKFDGSFIINYLLRNEYKQYYIELPNGVLLDKEYRRVEWCKKRFMPKHSFQYSISKMGQWYSIYICLDNGKTIEVRDSLKLLPFSLRRIGKSFKTKHQKLDMDYEGYRYAGCEITLEEEEYLKNDLFVIKEALEFMFNSGHDKLTIGSCCLEEFKELNAIEQGLYNIKQAYDERYPNLYEMKIPEFLYGFSSAGDYIHKAYHGGWCYLAKEKENKIYHNGTTADVNSLYPSMMHSESGNVYPFGKPHFWSGNIPEKVQEVYPNGTHKYFYFVRIKTSFKLREGYLPFIQIKGTGLYNSTEMLETSDIYDRKNKRYIKYIINSDGTPERVTVTLTMTMMDYALFLKHYEQEYLEVLDGCYFDTLTHLFDDYIDKYKKIKLESTGAMRELAKLFLNNLYGKMGATTDSSFKIASLEDGILKFLQIPESKKTPGYIPIGAAITSYARCFTITAAQANYHGVDKPGFIYADTDSIHCDLPPEEIKGIRVHDKNFCCWKLESCWDEAIFVRQKSYIEHVVKEDLHPIDNPYYNVKCAGMPEECKKLFVASLTGDTSDLKLNKLDEEEKEFIKERRSITDFKVGLKVPGKLVAKQIKGGVLLSKTTFEVLPIEIRL